VITRRIQAPGAAAALLGAALWRRRLPALLPLVKMVEVTLASKAIAFPAS